MKRFIRVMKALSDPNRITIIKMLAQKDLCVCETTSLLDLAQPTVSKHLKTLEDAGLVESNRAGTWVNYSLTAGEESIYAARMLQNMHEWLNDDAQILKTLTKLPQVNREQLCSIQPITKTR